MANISKITLPDGNTYNIDAVSIGGRTVDTSISKSSPTENIPTTAAVIDFIEDQPFGARASSSDAASTTLYLNGNMSDVRIYSTALSADDILALYNTPTSIASNGTLLTQGEISEV